MCSYKYIPNQTWLYTTVLRNLCPNCSAYSVRNSQVHCSHLWGELIPRGTRLVNYPHAWHQMFHQVVQKSQVSSQDPERGAGQRLRDRCAQLRKGISIFSFLSLWEFCRYCCCFNFTRWPTLPRACLMAGKVATICRNFFFFKLQHPSCLEHTHQALKQRDN